MRKTMAKTTRAWTTHNSIHDLPRAQNQSQPRKQNQVQNPHLPNPQHQPHPQRKISTQNPSHQHQHPPTPNPPNPKPHPQHPQQAQPSSRPSQWAATSPAPTRNPKQMKRALHAAKTAWANKRDAHYGRRSTGHGRTIYGKRRRPRNKGRIVGIVDGICGGELLPLDLRSGVGRGGLGKLVVVVRRGSEMIMRVVMVVCPGRRSRMCRRIINRFIHPGRRRNGRRIRKKRLRSRGRRLCSINLI